MALRRSSANENHDNRNFIDHTKQMRLFEDRNYEQSNIAAEVGQTIPWNEAGGSFWFRIFELFVTSPTAKRTTPVPPNAPIKPRKSFSKVGLKPKKLRFMDKEKDEIDGENCSQKSADYSVKILDHKATFSKEKGELKDKSSRENLSSMLRNIRLETDDKENKQYENERYERKVIDDRYSVIKERAKYDNNCMQSLKLNCNSKEQTSKKGDEEAGRIQENVVKRKRTYKESKGRAPRGRKMAASDGISVHILPGSIRLKLKLLILSGKDVVRIPKTTIETII